MEERGMVVMAQLVVLVVVMKKIMEQWEKEKR